LLGAAGWKEQEYGVRRNAQGKFLRIGFRSLIRDLGGDNHVQATTQVALNELRVGLDIEEAITASHFIGMSHPIQREFGRITLAGNITIF